MMREHLWDIGLPRDVHSAPAHQLHNIEKFPKGDPSPRCQNESDRIIVWPQEQT